MQVSAAVETGSHHKIEGRIGRIALAALGIVYGDIGTSPLYVLKECFSSHESVAPTQGDVLGILSLIFWSLTWVIVVKYLTFIMRADNHGEGGILALLALVTSKDNAQSRVIGAFVWFGLFGAALLYGDGIITPAISVLSAVEGLGVATHVFEPYIVPLTVTILIALFLIQKRGTAGIGALFGPVTLLWFITIAAIGIPWIIKEPRVLLAVSPHYAAEFMLEHGEAGFLALGSVVLCITGGEALYADMGHFGRAPIRLAWYAIVFPALLINYFGQGALLMSHGTQFVPHPFYGLVSGWLIYPLVVIATMSTVVASQALISGAFSLTHQAVQLGYAPRVTIQHTSHEKEGQIYIPEVNAALAIACVALVLGFKRSSALASAYGVAVTGTMTVTSVLFYAFIRQRWGTARALVLLIPFLIVDLSFFGANIVKVTHGGWIPLVIAACIFTIMTTWKRGRSALWDYVKSITIPMEPFLAELEKNPPLRVPGTAVFMTSNPNGVPPALRHHFRHSKVLHEQILMVTVITDHVPTVARKKRATLRDLGQGFVHVIAHYGFRQSPRVSGIIRACREAGLQLDDAETSFFLGRETLLLTGDSKMSRWRKWLFAFISRNARPATAYYEIPPDRVVELGMQIEL